ncbi:hypothetical protein RKD05_001701 [Microbacterium sp. SLBN-111]
MLTGTDDAEDVLVRDDGGQGQDATAQRLAEEIDVGHDAFAVARERLAHAAEARLDLVGDEQHVVLGADLPHPAEEPLRRDDDAGLALDRLEEHRGGVLVDRGGDGIRVSVGHMDEAGRVRTEVVVRGGVVAETDDRRGAAVEVTVRDDDGRGIRGDALRPVAPRAGDLDAGLDRLRAGVHRQHEILAAQLRERRGEGTELVVVEGAARERQTLQLLAGGGEDRRVPVAEVQRGVRRQQVEVALALDVGDPDALGARRDDRQRVVVVREVRAFGGDELRAEVVDGGAHRVPPRSSSVQHLMPPPPSSSSDRSTSTGV